MASRNLEWTAPVTRGTENVFADLGFPDAAERQVRLRLAYALNQDSKRASFRRPRLPRRLASRSPA
jgi:hypothetical protein